MSPQSEHSFLKLMGIIFLSVGVLMGVIGIVLGYVESTYDDKYDEISAEIVNIEYKRKSNNEKEYDVFVSYKYEGEAYENIEISLYDSSMYVGKNINIYIDPDNPSKTHIKSTGLNIIVFGGGAIGFILIAIPIFVASGQHGRHKLVDKGQGEAIYATVLSIANANNKQNDIPAYIVKAIWRDPQGTMHEYRSQKVYFDPAEYITEGELIKVYINPKNYDKYYVCVQELKEEKHNY